MERGGLESAGDDEQVFEGFEGDAAEGLFGLAGSRAAGLVSEF